MNDDKIRKMAAKCNAVTPYRTSELRIDAVLREELELLLKAAQEAAKLPGERGDKMSGVHTTALCKLAEVLKEFGR